MKDNAPIEVEPTKMSLEGGAIRSSNAVGEGSDKNSAGVVDYEAGHRDVSVIEHGSAWIEMHFNVSSLNRGTDEPFPSCLPIAKTNFVQAFVHSLDDAGRQGWIGDKSRRIDIWKAGGVGAVGEAVPDKALLPEIHQQAGAEPPELAVAEHLHQMLGGEWPTQTLQFRNEVILDHKVRLKGVCDNPAINQVTPRLGKVRDSGRRECRDELLVIDFFIKPRPDC